MRYNPQQIETCMVECSRQCSENSSLQDVIAQSLQLRSLAWPEDFNGSFQKSFLFAAKILLKMIDIVRVCPYSLRDETLRSNVWNILKRGLCDKADADQLTSHYDPHPANGVDNSTWNDKTLLAQLMLLADCGFYFYLSRLTDSPEEYQYMQVLFVLDLDHPKFFSPARDDDFYLRALPKLLGLPSLVSYVDIKKFANAFHETPYDRFTFRLFFEAFQRDPARSGGFHHDPARWHGFAATRFSRFLTTASPG